MGEALSVLNNREPVVFFDGVCNLCNGFVQFLIKNDKEGILSFSSLQSEAGEALQIEFPDLRQFDSVVLYRMGEVVVKSKAALQILSMLPAWRWTRFLRIFPLFFRDWIYSFIASNRFLFFGKRDSCMIPTPELKSRFIS